MNDFLIYLLILSGSTYLIRAVPFVAVKKEITNKYVRSFLHYIPFSVLAAMTIPYAFTATGNVISSICGLVVGGIFAYLVSNIIQGIPVIDIQIGISFNVFLGSTISLIVLNVLVGILPVMGYLKLTPSQILSKYDI